jgi:surfactin synthase thioesterase subunit
VTLVCVPFAGGGAVSYLPVARALRERDRAVRVLGADLPGRDRGDRRPAVPADQLVAELAAEIAAGVDGPVALLGHSAGAGVALATAARLGREGQPVAHLFLVGSLLRRGDGRVASGASRSDAGIRDFLSRVTELDGLADLPEEGWADLAEAFRYDAGCADELCAGLLRAATVFDRPATLVIGSDDPVIAAEPDPAGTWRALVPDLEVALLDGGGHYLNTSRPRELADRLLQALGRHVEQLPDQGLLAREG